MQRPLVTHPGTAQVKGFESYREQLQLDRNDLDRAAEDQAHLFMEVSNNHVAAVSERDAAKSALALVDAGLAIEVRRKSATKLSEGAVYDQVITLAKHQQAAADYDQKSRLAAEWGTMRDAFEMRSKMIQQLTQQFATGYFSTSRVTATPHIARTARAAEGREEMHNARTRLNK